MLPIIDKDGLVLCYCNSIAYHTCIRCGRGLCNTGCAVPYEGYWYCNGCRRRTREEQPIYVNGNGVASRCLDSVILNPVQYKAVGWQIPIRIRCERAW